MRAVDEVKKLKEENKQLKMLVGKREKYTTSATVLYLQHKKKMSLRDIRLMLGADLKTARKWLKGIVQFTQKEYEIIIKHFPQLEGCIGGF